MISFTPILVLFVAAFLYHPVSNDLSRVTGNDSSRVLLLTAHPDDEAMFFAPTILALKDATLPPVQIQTDAPEQVVFSSKQQEDVSTSQLYSLCLSNGNADGLGAIRTQELSRSLGILGIQPDKHWILDHPDLQDNMTLQWDPITIAEAIRPYILKHRITTVLTFDSDGISGHPNHKALPEGVKQLALALSDSEKPRLFTLISVPTFGKYTSVMGPFLGKFDLYASKALIFYEGVVHGFMERADLIPAGTAAKKTLMPVYVSGYAAYLTSFKAMLAHQSQLVWFRWLYLAFSRYMWINEWAEVKL
ncbi:hypothetical protein D9611_010465 [Ephemerocybe angulata]|uniref:N-acetylglucosaminylphosphatidylinositol deacetylase n=1 Tax=Ephemerocybe angulata TaxID=980116 RepID=A0A8H5FAP0_9AGAR|nr:hypothetical protein D9611_010465 [Tulosesus angulatus]